MRKRFIFFLLLISASIALSKKVGDVSMCDVTDQNQNQDLAKALKTYKRQRRPPGAQGQPDKSKFRQFKVYYHLMESSSERMDRQTAHLAGYLLPSMVNERFKRLQIKSSFLNDVRMPRTLLDDGSGCERPTCAGSYVSPPGEFLMPCRNQNGQLIPESDVPSTPTQKILDLNKENYSVVVFLESGNDGTSTRCKPTTSAFAGFCGITPEFRPSHGGIVICTPFGPTYVDDMRLLSTYLHETLHIMTATNLQGLNFPEIDVGNAQTAEDLAVLAENLTWKKSYRSWMTNPNGDRIQETVTYLKTPAVLDAVRRHFGCPDLEGVELAVIDKGTPSRVVLDNGHWNTRLFPEDVLSQVTDEAKRVSNITLAYLYDSKLYDVNFAKAEPLDLSQPRDQTRNCEVATKSCHEITRNTLNLGRGDAEKETFRSLGWYCDDGPNRFNYHRCTTDGALQVTCKSLHTVSGNCPVRMHFRNDPNDPFYYNTAVCHHAETQPSDLTPLGFKVGPNTTCVTVVKSTARPTPFPVCISFECRSINEIEFFLKIGTSKADWCRALCTPGEIKKSFTKFFHQVRNQPCNTDVQFLCPEVYAACANARGQGLSHQHHGNSCTLQSVGMGAIVLASMISLMIPFVD